MTQEPNNQPPSPLPLTLPKGTLFTVCGDKYRLLAPAERSGGLSYRTLGGEHEWLRSGSGSVVQPCSYTIEVREVDWSSVPAAAPVFAEGMRVRILDAERNGAGKNGQLVTLRNSGGYQDGRGRNWGTEEAGWCVFESCIEPVDPVGAKPVEESDEQSCKCGHAGCRVCNKPQPCEYCGGSRERPEQAYQFEYEPGKTLPCCRSCFRQNERTRSQPATTEPHVFGIPRQAEQEPRKPCGYGCRCVYCMHATANGTRVRADVESNHSWRTWNRPEDVAATYRLNAWELRQKPRVSPATEQMFKNGKAALRHWPSVSEDEP